MDKYCDLHCIHADALCDLIQADSDERVRSWWNGETEIAHLCQVVGSVQENFDAGVALRS